MMKRFKIICSVCSLTFLLLLMILNFMTSCFSFTMNNKAIHKYFGTKNLKVDIKYYDFEGTTIRYMESGSQDKPTVVFVHGAPGSMTNFIEFVADSNLNHQAHLVAVDRLGYGKSGYGKSQPSIKKQADAIIKLLNTLPIKGSVILVGHSFGGPIIGRMAIDYPEKIKALILVAPAIDPNHEKIFKISYAINKQNPIRWLTPTSLRVANDEKMKHIEELKKLEQLWQNIVLPITFIHGEADSLVPFENAIFGQKVLKNSKLEMVTRKDMGHLIPWQNPELIYQAIIKYL